MIYLDNAATSFPKPPEVVEETVRFLTQISGSAGRSGHRLSVEAGRVVYHTREALAELFSIDDPLRIAFGHNVTEALNLVLQGLLQPGDHVVTSSVEHNSMMRPLRALEQAGVRVSVVPCSPQGALDPNDLRAAVTPQTRLIALNHASNVIGTLLPIREAGQIARERGILLLVDAAQTAGCYPIDVNEDSIDLLAFTGHKALLGPTGTGGLYIGPRVQVEQLQPLMRGGTGSRSEHELQPDFMPDKYESGTGNALGLAGLGAGVRFILRSGVRAIRAHEEELTRQLLEGLLRLSEVRVYGPHDPARQTGTVSFNLDGWQPSEVSEELDERYAILSRPGLHCSPATHRTIGTYPGGTVRLSLGAFSTADEVATAVEAVGAMAKEAEQ